MRTLIVCSRALICRQPIDLSPGDLLYYGGVEWLNISDFLGKIKKGLELHAMCFVFKSAVVFLCKERLRQKKKLMVSVTDSRAVPIVSTPFSDTLRRPSSFASCVSQGVSTKANSSEVEIIRYQVLIPVTEVQVRASSAKDMESHFLWELIHLRSQLQRRSEKVYVLSNRYFLPGTLTDQIDPRTIVDHQDAQKSLLGERTRFREPGNLVENRAAAARNISRLVLARSIIEMSSVAEQIDPDSRCSIGACLIAIDYTANIVLSPPRSTGRENWRVSPEQIASESNHPLFNSRDRILIEFHSPSPTSRVFCVLYETTRITDSWSSSRTSIADHQQPRARYLSQSNSSFIYSFCDFINTLTAASLTNSCIKRNRKCVILLILINCTCPNDVTDEFVCRDPGNSNFLSGISSNNRQ